MHYLGRGHTNGDTVIYFPDLRAVHMGDLVIDGMPVIDYAGGGRRGVRQDDRQHAGARFRYRHPRSRQGDDQPEVQAYRGRFEKMNQRMRELIKKGVPKDQLKTLEQVRAELRLADLGWDNSVSTTASFGSFRSYYDEIAAGAQ